MEIWKKGEGKNGARRGEHLPPPGGVPVPAYARDRHAPRELTSLYFIARSKVRGINGPEATRPEIFKLEKVKVVSQMKGSPSIESSSNLLPLRGSALLTPALAAANLKPWVSASANADIPILP